MGEKGAAANFIVTVRKTAARQTDGKVRVRPQPADKAEFGIEIYRCERQPQRQVRAQEIRLVVIVKRVTGKRCVAFERRIVAELNQVAFDRINLRGDENRNEQRQPQQPLPKFFHAAFGNANPPRQQARNHSLLDTANILRLTIANLISRRCHDLRVKYHVSGIKCACKMAAQSVWSSRCNNTTSTE